MNSNVLRAVILKLSVLTCTGLLTTHMFAEQRSSINIMPRNDVQQSMQHNTTQSIRPSLKYIVSSLVADTNMSEQLSPELLNFHDALQQNKVISTTQFMKVLPLVMQYMAKKMKEVTTIKAPRPDAPSPKDSNAIVGPDTSGIDLTQFLSCCKQVLRRIGSVCDSSCCDTVLGILGDACEILGPDRTISDKLLELLSKISNLTATVEVTLDFNEVFTALEGLEETLCNKFEGVFTVLDTIITEDQQEFNGIFTTLDRICEKILVITNSVMISVDFDEIFTALEGLEETLCAKFEGTFTVLEDILDVEIDGFNGTFTVLDTICDKIEDLTATLLIELDFDGVFTALVGVEEVLCDKFEGVFTVLEEQGLCLPTPLTQADAVNGDILLDLDGINYCMAENITATILITGNNVNLDMNDRVLFGVININADDVIVENGKLQPFGPLAEGMNGPAITIGSENTVLRDLLILCEDTITFQVSGRIGILNGGDKTRILNCSIKSGGGGPGNAIFFNAPHGGDGIINTGDDLIINETIIETGFGGQQLTDGFGGNGGIGILNINGTPIVIQDCLIMTGSGGVAIEPLQNGSGGSGGIGIEAQAGSLIVKRSKIVTGEGGESEASPVSDGSSGGGMNFLTSVGPVIVDGCLIETGGSGRVSGAGVTYSSDSLLKVSRTCIITGETNFDSGYGLRSTSSCTMLSDITIKTLGSSFGSTGTGIILLGSANIESAVIATGNAGVSISPFDSGHGILALGISCLAIRNSTIATGNGGFNTGGVGGNAGHAIFLINSSDSLIDNCVLSTGTGGVGTGGNGDGGHTVFLDNAENVTILDTVSNRAGATGFEINDSRAICISHAKALSSTSTGFDFVGTTSVFVICDSTAVGCNGQGFLLGSGVFDGQVVSNQAENNVSGGIVNASGDMLRHQIWNNVANNNGGVGNFSGVALVIAAPTVSTGFYSNVIL